MLIDFLQRIEARIAVLYRRYILWRNWCLVIQNLSHFPFSSASLVGPLISLDVWNRSFFLPFPKENIFLIKDYLEKYSAICVCGNPIFPGDVVVQNALGEIFCNRSDCCDPGVVLSTETVMGYWGEGEFIPFSKKTKA
jgi:hypothetical protein